jgi:hypothetical protein
VLSTCHVVTNFSNAAIQDPVVESSGECSVFRLMHFLDQKLGEGFDVPFDTCALQGIHIGVAPLNAHNGPGISPRCQHRIQKEAADATVAVKVGMDEHEQMMSQYGANRWLRLLGEQIKQRLHGIDQRLSRQWRMHRVTDIDGSATIAGELVGFQDAQRYGRSKEFPVPTMMIDTNHLPRVLASEYLLETGFHRLEGLEISASSQRIPVPFILSVAIRIPAGFRYPFDQGVIDLIALD